MDREGLVGLRLAAGCKGIKLRENEHLKRKELMLCAQRSLIIDRDETKLCKELWLLINHNFCYGESLWPFAPDEKELPSLMVIWNGNINLILSNRCSVPHRFISWWWRTQLFSCSCKWQKSCEGVFFCPPVSSWSVSLPQCCSDVTCVCLISSSARLSFSSWLQATHTSVTYRLGKPANRHPMKSAAMTCRSSWN